MPIDTNFDEIVHFRNKEVVVYPDEATKPEQGEGLNRTAIISLERIWPLSSDRQLIKVRTYSHIYKYTASMVMALLLSVYISAQLNANHVSNVNAIAKINYKFFTACAKL